MPDLEPIRLIALDMDGTLLTSQKQITPRAMVALQAAIDHGIEVVPATGRTVSGVPREFMQLRGLHYALTSNGASVIELGSGRVLVDLPFEPALALALYDIVRGFDCALSVFIGGDACTDAESVARGVAYAPPEMKRYMRHTRAPVPDLRAAMLARPAHIEKFSILYPDNAARDAARDAVLARFPQVECTSSLGGNLELNAPGVNKGRGLLELARQLGLRPAQLMACGDSGNDLAMIRDVGWGVAMANADPEVKAAARFVTLDNDHDGVAAAVERLTLSGAGAFS